MATERSIFVVTVMLSKCVSLDRRMRVKASGLCVANGYASKWPRHDGYENWIVTKRGG
jgi:hypothetical protein